jgi:GTPase
LDFAFCLPEDRTLFFLIMNQMQKGHKAGYVAIVGEPNVGKSTLLNSLLNQKISIVTRKPQTTRQRVLGILSRDEAQIIFIDTPGLINPKYLLQEEMMKHTRGALKDSDLILVMVSADSEMELDVYEFILKYSGNKKALLAINKIDLLNNIELDILKQKISEKKIFDEIIPISALKQINLDRVISSMLEYLPEHEPFYPADIVSEYPERFFVAEFIREQLLKKFRKEIPYSSAVEIRQFKERAKGKTLINADIIVERDSQKGIIIGNKGRALKEIGINARKEIEDFLQREVYLDIHVKVKEKWRDNKMLLKQFGYSAKEKQNK